MLAPKIMIMGIGNVLLSDEGCGVQFLKELEEAQLPEDVELLEGGTAGLELVHLIKEADFLILIDAVNAQSDPGALFRFQPEELSVFPPEFQVSFHQVGIIEVLSVAKLLGNAPQTLIYGIQPKSLEWGMELSAEVRAVFPRLLRLVTGEIASIRRDGRFCREIGD
ncbi:MAG: HyaD/HybD family hydrogenase maturation endopeptidase [Peptococcaceae bacterium]|jgi:hydrogenase maturation protease|nr:HyaD/HybD family hydrogenase maturation endopeptidase [Peptococcaceae bacterium]